MKWLYSQFRLVLPRGPVIDTCVVFIGGAIILLECAYVLIIDVFHASGGWAIEVQTFWEIMGNGLIVIATLGYGLIRGLLFYPVVPTAYWKWLAITPYTGVAPLPKGPIRLVWQDLLIVTPLTALGVWHMGRGGIYVPCGVLGAYLLASLFFIGTGSAFGPLYGALYFMTAAFLLTGIPYVCLVLLVVAYAIVRLGFRTSIMNSLSLKEIDEYPGLLMTRNLAYKGSDNSRPLKASGWPWERLGPKTVRRLVPLWHAVTLSVWAGLFYWVCITKADPTPADRADVMYWTLGLVAVFSAGRLLVYLPQNRPPLSLMGRLGTGRLIIPGYDRVFVAPLLAVSIAYALPRLPFDGSVLFPLLNAGALGAGFLCVLAIGPSYSNWELTGDQRLAVCNFGNQQLYKKL